jgi:hypothetical protein
MTANQYLKSIGLGPVNPVCTKCQHEVGRVWTADRWCVECLQKRTTRARGGLSRFAQGDRNFSKIA